jgi:DNA processing protein
MFSSPPPLAPPTTEEDALRWLRLVRSPRVGPATFFRLTAEHGSVAAALDALPAIARASGVKDYVPCSSARADAELAAARRAGARLVCFGAADYPRHLAEIADPPPILWAVGDTALLRRPAVAIVGARNASSLGLRMAKALARGLGEAGCVTVSGLARGVDAACHIASIETGTVAVVAGGVDVVYPPENGPLARDIAAHGLILSEQPFGLEPQARHFPRRNRIVAGIARAVVVVEAAAKSGSLITARLALDHGREVMAVPGHPFDARAGGCNLLIRDGAVLVRGAEDVLAALGARQHSRQQPPAEQRAIPSRDAGDEGRGDGAHGTAGTMQTAREGLKGAPAGGGATGVPTPHADPVGEAHKGRPRAWRDPGHSRETAGPDGAQTRPSRPRGPTARSPAGAGEAHACGSAEEMPTAGRTVADRILALLGPSPIAEDQMLRDLGLPPQSVAEELLALELEGRVERRPGGLLALTG